MSMNISGVSGAGMQPNMSGMGAGAADQMDPVSKDLRRQIEDLQKQMQELSANQEMPMETKMKKRQELQKQISELEIQLRQRQIEVKREENQKKKSNGSSFDDLLGTKPQEKQGGKQSTGMSAGSMEALISADVSMKQADVHGSIATKMENRVGVIETEIMLDSGRGGSSNIGLKEEELAKTKALADQATASQMKSLAQANKTMQEAAEDEQNDKAGKTEAGTKTGSSQNIAVVEGEEQGTPGTAQSVASTLTRDEGQSGSQQEAEEQNTFDTEMMGVAFSRGYQPVDVRL
ncbi:MAG: hypothetical protein HDR13_03290 [Lachnospiraceae bacterium]|nr:hypothetical protein [Lachnospiraceae bacterium]